MYMSAEAAAAVLNVTVDASQDEIRRAWRGLALRDHPDKNPGDPSAAVRFRDATDAYKALAHGEVAYKSYEELCAEMDDVRTALQQAMDMSSRGAPVNAATAAKEKVLKIGTATWIGEVSEGRPHGTGDLMLPNGSVHHGLFESGRAHGAGILYDASGTIHRGGWVDNKRVGPFVTTDPKGGTWHDTHDAEGKRVARKKGAPPAEGVPAATKCVHCGVKFHAALNSRCLQHSGKWVEAPTHNADGSAATVDRVAFPEGGLWLCCGGKARGRGGCTIALHAAAAPPPAVPQERRIAPDAPAPAPGTAEPGMTVEAPARLPSFIESDIPTRAEYEVWVRSLGPLRSA